MNHPIGTGEAGPSLITTFVSFTKFYQLFQAAHHLCTRPFQTTTMKDRASTNVFGIFLVLLTSTLTLSCSCSAFVSSSTPTNNSLQRHRPPKRSTQSPSLVLSVSSDATATTTINAYDQSPPQQQQQPLVVPSQRKIGRIEKFGRLPVWPVWQGVFLFFASKIVGPEIAAQWEDTIGGRVCPNFFSAESTSPFVLLVHHRHAFMNWDPVRYIQKTFFPEGFPAHPHRGFVTVTYCLKGGMIHRDSLGIKMPYGAGTLLLV